MPTARRTTGGTADRRQAWGGEGEAGSRAPSAGSAPPRPWSEAQGGVEVSRRPVIGYQRWHGILMLHWELPPERLRPLVDRGVELDLHEGRAYVSLTPFTMKGARLRGAPALPSLREFHELNLRTYVRRDEVPGIWFFSLDAASTPAAALARATLGLPYFRARMRRAETEGAHRFESVRRPPCSRPATFSATWRPGALVPHLPGTLDDFLAERHALYSRLASKLLRVRVRHPPWVLRVAALEQLEQDVTRAAGLDAAGSPLLARCSRGTDVEVLAPELLE